MNKLKLIILSFFLITLVCTPVSARSLVSIDFNEVIICPATQNSASPPSFLEANCSSQPASLIDPQNTAIWIKAKLTITSEMLTNQKPYSVYVSGKASSQVYFNGELIGQNGTPSPFASEEVPGKIDSRFYVPPSLINKADNELVLLLSSHHGFIKLKSPLNFIGFGEYSDLSSLLQTSTWSSFIPLGALILGTLYFAASCFSPIQRNNNRLFLLMSLFAASQLIAELSRTLVSYDYPLHDYRLLAIVSLAFAFGVCLLTYMACNFSVKRKKTWIFSGSLLTLVSLCIIPGFDSKTAIAILIPCLVSIAIIVRHIVTTGSKQPLSYLVVFVFLGITIIFDLNRFHDLQFYYITTGVLGFLFVQRAFMLNREQRKRRYEEQQVAKLQLKLEQNQQKIKPNKIKINSAGKIELVSTNEIAFCKAAGDYVEIHLMDKREKLFSGNLKELEKLLPTTFLRVHRSYVVNIDDVLCLKKQGAESGQGIGCLELTSGHQVPVSRRIMPMVRSVLNKESE
jgi:LytTr DNA-binding domain